MAPPRKIVDVAEAVRWIEERRTYRWMVEEHERKYGIRLSPTTFSRLRATMGLPRRATWDAELIPWKLAPRHQEYPSSHLWALRAEARLRDGKKLRPIEVDRLDSWKRKMADGNLVVHYDAATDEGFFLVPRREGVDDDLIRKPSRVTRERKPRD